LYPFVLESSGRRPLLSLGSPARVPRRLEEVRVDWGSREGGPTTEPAVVPVRW